MMGTTFFKVGASGQIIVDSDSTNWKCFPRRVNVKIKVIQNKELQHQQFSPGICTKGRYQLLNRVSRMRQQSTFLNDPSTKNNVTPGPGKYNIPQKLIHNSSNKKKQQSFLSRRVKTQKQVTEEVPGPGHYHLPQIRTQRSYKFGLKPKSTYSNVDSPGPCQYLIFRQFQ